MTTFLKNKKNNHGWICFISVFFFCLSFLLIHNPIELPADQLYAAAQKNQEEYLAFEFFFDLTGRYSYPRIRMDYDDPTLQDFEEKLGEERRLKPFFDTTRALLDYRNENFKLFVDWSMIGDERYDPTEVYMRGRYFYINDAHISYTTDRFSIKAGRTTHSDVVDTPYSLFVSSEDIPAVQVETRYTGDLFFYTSRWVRLNKDSAQVYFGSTEHSPYWEWQPDGEDYPYKEQYPDGIHWLDRGSNFKVYGLNLGNWRFGFQESAVYLNETFNAEFFLSPMIMFITQLLYEDGSKPWLEYANSKHAMGFFLDRTTGDSYFASQLLIDDVNATIVPGLDKIVPLDDVENVNRLAWSFGGSRRFDFGRIGLYHGGSTQDTFAATHVRSPDWDLDRYTPEEVPLYYSRLPYPYTYYPAVFYDVENGIMAIDYEKNYIGYKHGENNLSFMLDYSKTFLENRTTSYEPKPLSLYASLEWVLNGAKSPANPWHEDRDWKQIEEHTRLLSGTVEHQLKLRSRVDKAVSLFNIPFSLYADIEAGVIFNAMKLEMADSYAETGEYVNEGLVTPGLSEPWIYRPQSGQHEPIFSLTLGLSYLWRIK